MKKATLHLINDLQDEVKALRKANQEQWTELRQTLVEIKIDYARRLDELTEKYNKVVVELLNRAHRMNKNGDNK